MSKPGFKGQPVIDDAEFERRLDEFEKHLQAGWSFWYAKGLAKLNLQQAPYKIKLNKNPRYLELKRKYYAD